MAGHGRVIQSFQRLTGDPRGNENPGLLAVTGLWVLEHNRLCDELAEANPSWSDTELFEEARKRVIALVQHVTISEYLPVLTGEPLPAYPGYDPGVAAGVYGEFAVAAYRYGKLPPSYAPKAHTYGLALIKFSLVVRVQATAASIRCTGPLTREAASTAEVRCLPTLLSSSPPRICTSSSHCTYIQAQFCCATRTLTPSIWTRAGSGTSCAA